MDQQAARRMILSTFSQAFDRQRYELFLRNLFNNFEMRDKHYTGNLISENFRQHVKQYWRVGKYVDPDGEELDLLVVEVTSFAKLERARSTLRNFAVNRLKRFEKDGSLIAFYAKEDGGKDWRFSLVRMAYKQELTDSGRIRVREEVTRRYSFLMGENEPNHTAQQQIVPILQDDRHNPTISELEQAFSVEAVTKQFFLKYRELFEKLTAELERIVKENERVRGEFESKLINPANFAKKLLGQIVFLYFLQKKGWLGVGKDDQGNLKPWGTGPKNFLQRLFNKEFVDYVNFFNDVLEPLFYHALAAEHDYDYYPHLQCKIPFLNGGLFEAIHDYNWREIRIPLPNNLFQQIFATFDRYNFTVREDEPLEKEVAVDPEMLGKVFENLLPENLRKGKGTYYTPRPIVHYMCQESLINYLAGECEGIVPKEDIEELVRRGESAVEHDAITVQKLSENPDYKGDYKTPKLPKSIISNAQLLDNKLAEIKVCDPAVGSGAFPVGMMHEIVKARSVLTTYLPDKSGGGIYTLKRHCIQESLYGVDIDAGAIDIAKLRLWLSLIVDEEDYGRINPLPNLDYKIMQGNSLIEDFHGISLDVGKSDNGDLLGKDAEVERLIKDMHEKQNAFFNATHPGDKRQLKDAVEEAIVSIFHYELEKTIGPYRKELEEVEKTANRPGIIREQYLQEERQKLQKRYGIDPEAVEDELREMTHGNKLRSFFPWRLYFADVFQKKNGFDVVIGNPPYNAKLTDAERSDYKRRYKSVSSGRQDTAAIFVEVATKIASSQSVADYILPYRLFSRKRNHGQFQMWLLENHDIREVIYVGPHPGFTANDEFMLLRLSVDRSAEDVIDVAFKPSLASGRSAILFTRVKQSLFLELREINLSLLKYDLKLLRKIANGSVVLETICKVRDGIVPYIREKLISDRKLDNRYVRFAGIAGKYLLHRYYFSCDDLYLCYDINEAKKYIKDPVELRKVQLRDREIFLHRKIITAQNSTTLKGTIDEDKLFVSNSIHSTYLRPEREKEVSLEYILGLMNSTLMNFFHDSMRVKATDLHPQILVTNLKKLPVKIAYPDKQDSVATLVKKILAAKKRDPKADTKTLEQEIDGLVYDLYRLTPEEIKVVEETTK